jgi:hypothetical protein
MFVVIAYAATLYTATVGICTLQHR